jgi:hypothetical protein
VTIHRSAFAHWRRCHRCLRSARRPSEEVRCGQADASPRRSPACAIPRSGRSRACPALRPQGRCGAVVGHRPRQTSSVGPTSTRTLVVRRSSSSPSGGAANNRTGPGPRTPTTRRVRSSKLGSVTSLPCCLPRCDTFCATLLGSSATALVQLVPAPSHRPSSCAPRHHVVRANPRAEGGAPGPATRVGG